MRVIRTVLLILAVALVASCGDEGEVKVLDEYESADLAARAWSFQVYPGSEFLPDYTDAFRRSHALLNPSSPEPPPIAVYDTEASVEDVAQFYVETYGYDGIAPTPDDPSDDAPSAYLTSGDIGVDTRKIGDLLRQLGYEHDVSALEGEWRGAHIAPVGPYPRVTIQRPYFHFASGEVRDRTLILMVRE